MSKHSGCSAICAVAVAAMLGIDAVPAPAHAAQRAARPFVASQHAETTTINFSHIPVRSALELIAEEGHFDLVLSDAVQGTISLHLVNVTWEQALDIVLRLKSLRQSVEGNTRSVTGADE